MNILKSLLNNETIKQQIMAKFVSGFREQGINKIMVELTEDDQISIIGIKDGESLINTKEHEFLKDYFKQNFKL